MQQHSINVFINKNYIGSPLGPQPNMGLSPPGVLYVNIEGYVKTYSLYSDVGDDDRECAIECTDKICYWW
jgi:hypothetical protein